MSETDSNQLGPHGTSLGGSCLSSMSNDQNFETQCTWYGKSSRPRHRDMRFSWDSSTPDVTLLRYKFNNVDMSIPNDYSPIQEANKNDTTRLPLYVSPSQFLDDQHRYDLYFHSHRQVPSSIAFPPCNNAHSSYTKYQAFGTRVRVIVQEFPRTTVKPVTTTSQDRTTRVMISHTNDLEEIESDDEE